MITEETTKKLKENWEKETQDHKTQRWREDLPPEEAALVSAWDREHGSAMAFLGGKGKDSVKIEPTVRIMMSEIPELKDGEEMWLSAADRRYQEIQAKYTGAKGGKAAYEFEFGYKGERMSFYGSFEAGTDRGDLYSHIEREAGERAGMAEKIAKDPDAAEPMRKFYQNELRNARLVQNQILPILRQYRHQKSPIGEISAEMPARFATPSASEKRQEAVGRRWRSAGAGEFKGYAYVKGTDQPKVFSGKDREEILEKLRQINQTMDPEKRYVYCNIGSRNSETGKYEDYHKFYIESGQEAAPVYLELPKTGAEEFKKIIADLKERGAKFQPKLKKWYIEQAQVEEFREYIPVPAKPQECVINAGSMSREEYESIIKAAAEEAAKPFPFEVSEPGQTVNTFYAARCMMDAFDNEYIVKLKNGNTVRLNEAEVLRRAAGGKPDMRDILEHSVFDSVQTIESDKGYIIAVSRETYDNRCSVCFNDQRPVVDLLGDQFGVYFPSLTPEEIQDIVENEMDRRTMEMSGKDQTEYCRDDQGVFYVPVYEEGDYGIQFVAGVKTVTGEVEDILPDDADPDHKIYMVREQGGELHRLDSGNLYGKRQADILTRAQERGFTVKEIDLMADRQLSSAQMEQLYESIRDGLPAGIVTLYANPKIPAWQMDLFRYGFSNGLTEKEIGCLFIGKPGCDVTWEDCRRKADGLIREQRARMTKDLKRNGFQADKKILRKMEKLNSLLNQKLGVKEINEAYRNSAYLKYPEANKMIGELAKDFQRQELLRSRLTLAAPEP